MVAVVAMAFQPCDRGWRRADLAPSADLKRVKSLTMGCPLIMGATDSIGRAPGQASVVMTRDAPGRRKARSAGEWMRRWRCPVTGSRRPRRAPRNHPVRRRRTMPPACRYATA